MQDLETYLNSRYSPVSTKGYLRIIRLYQEACLHSEQATQGDILEYLGSQRSRNYQPATLHNILAGIKVYYAWLAETGIRNDNPTASLTLRDARRKKTLQVQELLTPEQLALLLEPRSWRYALLARRNWVILSLLVYQGLKRLEITGIRVRDVDTKASRLHIKGSRTLKGRNLYLHPRQVEPLRLYLEYDRPQLLAMNQANRHSQQLLIGKLGTDLTGDELHYLIETCRPVVGCPKLTPELIRASVIHNLLKEHDILTVMDYCGHKYPSSTSRFQPDDTEQLAAEIGKFHPMR